MTRTLLSALRLIAGLGVMLFSVFALTATVLIFFAPQGIVLAWDDGGPCWPFAMIGAVCLFASLLWLMLWHILPRQERRFTRRWSPQRPPLTVASGTTGPVTAFMNTLS